jgi:hypothetical protein
VKLPYEPPAEFDLLVEFTSVAGLVAHVTAARVPVSCVWRAGGPCAVVADRQVRAGGDDEVASDLVHDIVFLAPRPDARQVAVVQVRRNWIGMFLNGNLIYERWDDLESLRRGPNWAFKDHSNRLVLETLGGATRVHRIEVVEVSGPGRVSQGN